MVSIGPWQYNFTSEKEQLLYNSNKNSWSQSVCYLEVSLYKELNKDSDSLVTNCKLPYYIQGTHLVATKQFKSNAFQNWLSHVSIIHTNTSYVKSQSDKHTVSMLFDKYDGHEHIVHTLTSIFSCDQ